MRPKHQDSRRRNALLICMFAAVAWLFMSRIQLPVTHKPPANITVLIPTQQGAMVSSDFSAPEDTEMEVVLHWEGKLAGSDLERAAAATAETSHVAVTLRDVSQGKVQPLTLGSDRYDGNASGMAVDVAAGHGYEVTCRTLKTDRVFAASRPTLTIGVSM